MAALSTFHRTATLHRTAAPGTSLPSGPLTARLAAAVQSRQLRAGDEHGEGGMTTAEYAVGTVAACGFSGVLYKIITSESILELVKGVIGKAFKLSF